MYQNKKGRPPSDDSVAALILTMKPGQTRRFSNHKPQTVRTVASTLNAVGYNISVEMVDQTTVDVTCKYVPVPSRPAPPPKEGKRLADVIRKMAEDETMSVPLSEMSYAAVKMCVSRQNKWQGAHYKTIKGKTETKIVCLSAPK